MSGASLQSGWRASRSTDIRPRPVLPPPGGAFLCALVSQTRRSAQRCGAEPGPRIFVRLTWAPALQRTAEEALRCVRGTRASILDLREIRDRTRGAADLVEQLQPVLTHLRIVVVDAHLLEERIDRR